MNIYEINAGEFQYIEEYIDEWARREWMHAITIVAAPTRNKARQLFCAYFNVAPYYLDLEYTQKMSIHLQEKDVNCAEGVDTATEWMCQQDPRCVEMEV